eukprot:scaffold4442_cov125-Amphora_coffeaeformis.AAC.16
MKLVQKACFPAEYPGEGRLNAGQCNLRSPTMLTVHFYVVIIKCRNSHHPRRGEKSNGQNWYGSATIVSYRIVSKPMQVLSLVCFIATTVAWTTKNSRSRSSNTIPVLVHRGKEYRRFLHPSSTPWAPARV